jgi:hypothetical protein
MNFSIRDDGLIRNVSLGSLFSLSILRRSPVFVSLRPGRRNSELQGGPASLHPPEMIRLLAGQKRTDGGPAVVRCVIDQHPIGLSIVFAECTYLSLVDAPIGGSGYPRSTIQCAPTGLGGDRTPIRGERRPWHKVDISIENLTGAAGRRREQD